MKWNNGIYSHLVLCFQEKNQNKEEFMLKYFLHAFRSWLNFRDVIFRCLFLVFFCDAVLYNQLLLKNAKLVSCYINIQKNHGISETLCGFLRITSVYLNVILCLLGSAVHLILHN